MSKVLLGQTHHDGLALRMEPSRAQGALRAAKGEPGHGLCECITPPRKLVIRERNGSLHLAVWPEDGHRHSPACVFHRDAPEHTGLSSLAHGAVVEREGGFYVRPAFSLMRAVQPPTPTIAKPAAGGAPLGELPAAPGLPLYGLLHCLWDHARLNRWATGWRRDYWRVVRELRDVAQHGHVGRHALHECLYVPPAFRADRVAAINDELDAFLQQLRPAGNDQTARSGLVLGRITRVQACAFGGYRLGIGHMRLQAHANESVQHALAKQYARGLHTANLPSDAPTMCMGLLQVELSHKGLLRIVDAALMVVTRDYIPVDSVYEARVAAHLVSRNRTFSKPLSYGAREGLPSFMLLDTTPPVDMEVCGLSTTAAHERLATKMHQHQQKGHAVWLWDASRGQPIPELPAPRRKAPAPSPAAPAAAKRSVVAQD